MDADSNMMAAQDVERVRMYSIIVGFCLIIIFVVPCMMLALLSKCCQKSSNTARKGSTIRRAIGTLKMTYDTSPTDSDYSTGYGVFGLLDMSASKLDCAHKITNLKGTTNCIDTWKAYAPHTLFSGNEGCEKIIAVRKLSGHVPRTMTTQNAAKESHSSCLKAELSLLSRIPAHHSILNLLGVCKPSSHVNPSALLLEYPLYGPLHSFLVCKRRACLADNSNQWAGLSYTEQEETVLQAVLEGNRQYLSPLLENYDLRSHPYKAPLNAPLSELDILLFGLQIAHGMDFLTNAGIIHKQLSTENIIISPGFFLKLSGMFGETPAMHKNASFVQLRRTPSGRNMVRWDAPELLEGEECTEATEIWRYGMILWEICSLGDVPFGDTPGRSLIDLLKKGDIPRCPEGCSDGLYSLMKECWHIDPRSRPNFLGTIRMVSELLQPHEDMFSSSPKATSFRFKRRPSILRPDVTSTTSLFHNSTPSPDGFAGYIETDV